MTNETTPTETKQPTFNELAESSGSFVAAKNFREGQKVIVHVDSYDKLSKSEKFGRWQAIYKVSLNGESKLFGLSGKMIQTLRDEHGIKDFPQLVGKTVTLLVVKGATSLTWAVVEVK